MSGSDGLDLAVLLVEDDPDHAFLVRRGLSGALGSQTLIDHVERVADAVALLREGRRFDCILCDLTLPDARGLDALEALRGVARAVPVVVLTSHDSDRLGLLALQAGAQDYLVKSSVDAGLVSRSVRFAIERSAREQAEAAHSRVADQLRLVLEATVDGVCWLDLDGRITYLNASGAEILGVAAPDALGEKLHDLGHCGPHGEPLPEADCGLLKAIRAGIAVDSGAQSFLRPDGTVALIDVRIRPVTEGERLTGVVGTFTDVTEAHRARAALTAREAQLAEAQRVARLGSFEHDLELGEVNWSPEFARLADLDPLALTASEAVFEAYLSRVPEAEQQAVRFLLSRPSSAGVPVAFQHRMRAADGSLRWLDCHIDVRERDSRNRPLRLVGTVQDITEQKIAEEALEHAAVHDALTGLANRALFADRLERALRAEGAGPVAVVLLDLDRFKWVNESLSHTAGDDLLVQAATALRDVLRPNETLARLGGDEFVVLAEGLQHEGEALEVAERMASGLGRPFIAGGQEVAVTASMGIAVGWPGSGVEPEGLLRDADAAMYRAKDNGRGRYEVFDERMRSAAVHRLDTEQAIRVGLERREFTAHYQPILDLDTGDVVGVEALARWRHPTRGLLAPADFISIAEDTGMIHELGHQVLEEACRQVVTWNLGRVDRPPIRLAVNLSPRQVNQPGFADQVRAVVAACGLAPANLCLEITESVLIADDPIARIALDALRRDGVRLSIDDFGTGYSSLAYLQRLAVDELKIDRSFVAGLGRDGGDLAIVTAIVRLAEALRLEVVAEGVAEAAHVTALRSLGVRYGQGYVLGRPLAASAYTALGEPTRLVAVVPEPRSAGQRR